MTTIRYISGKSALNWESMTGIMVYPLEDTGSSPQWIWLGQRMIWQQLLGSVTLWQPQFPWNIKMGVGMIYPFRKKGKFELSAVGFLENKVRSQTVAMPDT